MFESYLAPTSGIAPDRDLASIELWETSLQRSLRRRALAEQHRRAAPKTMGTAAAVSTALMLSPVLTLSSAGAQSGGAAAASAKAQTSPKPLLRSLEGRILRRGAVGPVVARVQRVLGVTADGIFGPITARALRDFQSRSGLPRTGQVDARTRQALAAAATTAPAPATTPAPAQAQAPGNVPAKAPGKAPAKAPPKASGKAPAKASGKAPAKAPGKAPGKAPAKAPAKASGKAPAKASGKAPAKAPGKAPAKASGKAPAKAPGKAPAKASGKAPAKAPAPPPAQAAACGATLVSPVGGTRSSNFGDGRSHQGVDIAAPVGRAVRAVACGVVSFTGTQSGYGRMICIQHTPTFSTCYAHLSTIDVAHGETVAPGQFIGRIGMTGRTYGAHLHFETRVDGQPRDPSPYLSGARTIPGVAPAPPAPAPAAAVSRR